MFSPHQAIGNIGENWVHDQLKKRGHDIQYVTDFFAAKADLRIGLLPIEVKYSRRTFRNHKHENGSISRYQRWQWNVSGVNHDDLVLFLIAEDQAGDIYPFIMPGTVMGDRVNFQIQRHPKQYQGLISGFLNKWETIDYMLRKLYKDHRQMDIYEAMSATAWIAGG